MTRSRSVRRQRDGEQPGGNERRGERRPGHGVQTPVAAVRRT